MNIRWLIHIFGITMVLWFSNDALAARVIRVDADLRVSVELSVQRATLDLHLAWVKKADGWELTSQFDAPPQPALLAPALTSPFLASFLFKDRRDDGQLDALLSSAQARGPPSFLS